MIAAYTVVLAVSTRQLWRATATISEHTERALISTERAFVFGKGFQVGLSVWDGILREYLVFVTWENAGSTPATDVHNWIDLCTFPMNENREPAFAQPPGGPTTVLGPRATSQSGYIVVPVKTMREKWLEETEIYVWCRIEYRDVFNPGIIRHHEQCACVGLIHEPSSVPPEGHPPYVTFSVYGPQNTTS